MYSHEIDSYIRINRNNVLTVTEYFYVSDVDKSPQIDHIKYEPFEDVFKIWTKDGYFWEFKVIKLDEN